MATRRTGTAKRTSRTTTRAKRATGARTTTAGARPTAGRRTAGTSRMKTARGTGRTAARGTAARRTGAGTRGRAASSTAASTRPTNGFGSIFRMAVRPGRKADLKKLMTDQRAQPVRGMQSVHLFDTGGDELWGVAIFKNEKMYRDNASSPEQNQRYQQFRALLETDPEWHDANIQSFQG
jgi:hypothetical protein